MRSVGAAPLDTDEFPFFMLFGVAGPVLSSCLDLRALDMSTGVSANPIIILAIVPSRAEAPPEMGSQGPSSGSYSRGRYLKRSVAETADVGRTGSHFEITEI